MVKHLSTMQEAQVRSLGQEDPLEKEMAIHTNTIAWKIPWREEPGRLQSMGSQRVGPYQFLCSCFLTDKNKTLKCMSYYCLHLIGKKSFKNFQTLCEHL